MKGWASRGGYRTRRHVLSHASDHLSVRAKGVSACVQFFILAYLHIRQIRHYIFHCFSVMCAVQIVQSYMWMSGNCRGQRDGLKCITLPVKTASSSR